MLPFNQPELVPTMFRDHARNRGTEENKIHRIPTFLGCGRLLEMAIETLIKGCPCSSHRRWTQAPSKAPLLHLPSSHSSPSVGTQHTHKYLCACSELALFLPHPVELYGDTGMKLPQQYRYMQHRDPYRHETGWSLGQQGRYERPH
jgi:hypothetical protein